MTEPENKENEFAEEQKEKLQFTDQDVWETILRMEDVTEEPLKELASV